MRFLAVASALSLVSLACAQTTIQVGAEATTNGGIFQFIPPTINATNGTVVTFQFTGVPGNHSVTQSTFSDPCDPMSGGFDSGWVLQLSQPSQTLTWNLTITDDTKPLWFFCKQLLPMFHCSAGMVGAINAPASGSNTFQAFQQNAKSFKGTPGQGEGALVGVGASASAGPGPSAAGVTLFTATSTVGSASASGSAASNSGSASATGTSPASTGTTTASGAIALSGGSFVALIGAALGFALA